MVMLKEKNFHNPMTVVQDLAGSIRILFMYNLGEMWYNFCQKQEKYSRNQYNTAVRCFVYKSRIRT